MVKNTAPNGAWKVRSMPWAIRVQALSALEEIEGRIDTGLRSQPSERFGFQVVDSVAVIPVYGVLEQRPDLFTLIFGGTAYELIGAQITEAVMAEDIARIVLDIDSPGGSVQGVAELADMIWTAKDKKPIVAIANNTCASAAYWIASACSEVVLASETSLVGSIGVVAIHRDISKAEEKMGVKTTEVVAGRYKRAASPHEPLGDLGREVLQAQVDKLYSIFVNSVAKYRGISAISVHERMGDGREFIGQDAIDAGLANRIQSLAELLSRQAYNSGKITYQTREVVAMEEQEKKVQDDEKPADPAVPVEEEKEEGKEKEKEMDEKEKARAEIAERERILGILTLSGTKLDDLAMNAISGGLTREQYALKALEARPPHLESIARESRLVPVSSGEVDQDEKMIAKAVKTVNERRR